MDWIITIPKTVKWEDWLAEVKDAEERKLLLNFKIPFKLVNLKNTDTRCYVVHDGFVRGYNLIVGCHETDGFKCETTGKVWSSGIYIQRTPHFFPLSEPIPMKGFQGIRRFNEVACKSA